MTNKQALRKARKLDKETEHWCDGGWDIFRPLHTVCRLEDLIKANPEAADMEYIPEPNDMIEGKTKHRTKARISPQEQLKESGKFDYYKRVDNNERKAVVREEGWLGKKSGRDDVNGARQAGIETMIRRAGDADSISGRKASGTAEKAVAGNESGGEASPSEFRPHNGEVQQREDSLRGLSSNNPLGINASDNSEAFSNTEMSIGTDATGNTEKAKDPTENAKGTGRYKKTRGGYALPCSLPL